MAGLFPRDIVLTRGEVNDPMSGLLTSDGAPTGTTRLADRLDDNYEILGRRYVSELGRNFCR